MIDYSILDRSTKYYETRGFARVESPWLVTPSISAITKPKDKADYTITEKGKVLVASGEQSFLYMYLKDFLPLGSYQTITPCFRDEPFDSTHTKYFMKNELIITKTVSSIALMGLIDCCQNFFQMELFRPVDIEKQEDGSFDLTCNGIELGSYGIRSCDFLKWIYGTGVAEPRMSLIKKKLNNA